MDYDDYEPEDSDYLGPEEETLEERYLRQVPAYQRNAHHMDPDYVSFEEWLEER